MSDLDHMPAIPATPTFDRTADMRGDLGQLRPSATWQLPNGIFARGEVAWFDQFLSGSAFPLPGSAPAPPGRSFVQANLYGGYRFPNRRCDLTVGVLNLGGGDYHLSPINYYLELVAAPAALLRPASVEFLRAWNSQRVVPLRMRFSRPWTCCNWGQIPANRLSCSHWPTVCCAAW